MWDREFLKSTKTKNTVYYKIAFSHHIEEGKALSSLDRGCLEKVGRDQGRVR